MGEQEFSISSLYKGYAARAARVAVLYTLVKRKKGVEAYDTRQSIRKLLCVWRRQVRGLLSAGWGRLADEKVLKKLLECRPGFGKVLPETWFCSWKSWCPWCWSREVMGLFRIVARAAKQHPGYQLVTDRLEQLVPLVYGTPEPGAATLHSLLQANTLGRRSVIKELSPTGAYLLCTAEPHKDKRRDDRMCWKVVLRSLYLLPGDCELPAWMASRARTEPAPLTREALYKAVGRVMRYPRGLLFGEPSLVSEVLDARRGFRLEACYGVFRKKKGG